MVCSLETESENSENWIIQISVYWVIRFQVFIVCLFLGHIIDQAMLVRQEELMKIIMNGKKIEVQSQTLRELIDGLGFAPDSLIVEKNRQLVKREAWTETTLQQGDRLELLNFVGGG